MPTTVIKMETSESYQKGQGYVPQPHHDYGAVVRYDSGDELVKDDHPWEWIYAKRNAPDEHLTDNAQGKRRTSNQIIGARTGNFSYRVGEFDPKEAWVGMICNFEEDENGEKAVNVMWFTTERKV